MVRKNIIDNMESNTKNINELKEKLDSASESETVDIKTKIKTIETNIKNMEKKKKDIEEQLVNMEKQLSTNF
jgi:predicted  nucleic acid-binding Zn-ribbon protein